MSYVRPARSDASGGSASREPRDESASGGDAAGDRPLPRATSVEAPRTAPRGRMTEREWRRAGTLASGIVIGALLGAGAALLLAPMSGADTRRFLASRTRELGTGAGDRWDQLRDELRLAARRRRRRMRRGVTRGRWAVADLLDE